MKYSHILRFLLCSVFFLHFYFCVLFSHKWQSGISEALIDQYPLLITHFSHSYCLSAAYNSQASIQFSPLTHIVCRNSFLCFFFFSHLAASHFPACCLFSEKVYRKEYFQFKSVKTGSSVFTKYSITGKLHLMVIMHLFLRRDQVAVFCQGA